MNVRKIASSGALAVLLCHGLPSPAHAQKSYSPHAGRNFPAGGDADETSHACAWDMATAGFFLGLGIGF